MRRSDPQRSPRAGERVGRVVRAGRRDGRTRQARRPGALRRPGLVALSLLLAAPAVAHDWVRVRTTDLEVLSEAGAAPAHEAAARVERLRAALRRLLPGLEARERPLTLILFGTRTAFERFVPDRHRRPDRVEGFFHGGRERDYAVLHFDPARPRPFGAAEHETVHLALNASLPAQPVWVAEGLAELLSDAAPDDPHGGNAVLLGAGRPDLEAVLAREPLLPLATLLEIGHDSPAYLSAESAVLYAECWALARWVVHRRGLTGLRAFLDAVAAGHPVEAAFEARFGSIRLAEETLGQVPGDPLFRVPLPEPAATTTPRSDVPADADVQQRLGELLLQGGRVERARAHLARALATDPGHVPARTSLVRLLTREGEWEGARGELARTLSTAPADPTALLERARLRVEEALARGEPLPTAVRDRLAADLEDAVRRAPGLLEAAMLLTRLRPRPYAARIALLQPLFDAQPERVALAQTLSHLHVKNRDLPAARRVLERAREVADEPAYRFLFDHLLARIGGFEAQTAEVRGRLVELECPSDGSLRFTIAGDSSTLRLAAASARSFFIEAADDGRDQRQLVCGTQDLPLEVRYRRSRSVLDPLVAGHVVWVSFGAPARERPRQ